MSPTPLLVRRWWGALAVLAGLGTLASVGLSAVGTYAVAPEHPSGFGGHPDGWSGAGARLADALAYFTHWSSAMVTLAAWRVSQGGRATWERVLLLCALLMTTVTGIVYALLLAPTTPVRGWEHVTNPWVHVVIPLATVALWLALGPRGWLDWRLVPAALAVPVLWVGVTLARGALVDHYPYDFLDVVRHGYAEALQTVAGILGFGIVVAATYCLVDVVLVRLAARRG